MFFRLLRHAKRHFRTGVVLFVALTIVVGFMPGASANHPTSAPLWGVIKDSTSGSPLVGKYVWYCSWLSSDTTMNYCQTSGMTDGRISYYIDYASDTLGHWYLNGATSGNRYRFFVSSSSTSALPISNPPSDVTYTGTSLQVPDIYVSSGGTIPAAPSNLVQVNSVSNAIGLYWTDNAVNEDKFNVERAPAGSTSYALVQQIMQSNVITYTDTSVTQNVVYDYRVQACLSGAGCSGYTYKYGVATPPTAPSNLTATVSGSTVTLNWTDSSSNEAGFKVYRGPTWTDIGNVGPNVTTKTDTPPAGTYLYRVQAFSGTSYPGYSYPSNDTQSVTVGSGGTYMLTVYKSGFTNYGTVTSTPAGISCGSGCTMASYSFPAGTSVTLNATTSTGYSFGGWSGNCSGISTCILTMNASYSGTAQINATTSGTEIDLVTQSLAFTPSGTIATGDLMSFSAVAKNNGTASSGSFSLQLRLDVNGDGTWDIFPALLSISGLSGGGQQGQTWTGVWNAAAGSHKMEVCADPQNFVAETNKTNNCTVVSFTVGATSSGKLFGFAKDAQGLAASGVGIQYYWDPLVQPVESGTPSFAGYTDTTGYWSFTQPQKGYYRFRAVGPGTMLSGNRDMYFAGGLIQVPDLTLSSSSTIGSISGFVFRAGQPFSGVTIEAKQDSGTFTQTTTTGSDGSYRFTSLPVGFVYRILVTPSPSLAAGTLPAQLISVTAGNSNPRSDFFFSATTFGTGTVTGRVADEVGVGVGNVRLEGRQMDGGGFQSVISGADGSYQLTLSTGTWEVAVLLDTTIGYIPVQSSFRFTIAAGTINNASFTLRKGGATIGGRVLDERGVPVNFQAGVYVIGAPIGTSVAGGAFTLRLPGGTYALQLWLPPGSGYSTQAPKTVTVAEGQTIAVDLVVTNNLIGGGKVEGTIVDSSGAAITNVDARIFAGSNQNWIPGTVDAATGHFSLILPPGVWALGYEVRDSRYVSTQATLGDPVTITAGQVISRNITLVKNDTTLTIQVKKSDGSVFANTGVEVSAAPFSFDSAKLGSVANVFHGYALSDAQGNVRVSVPAGAYYIRAFAPTGLLGGINPPEQNVSIGSGESKIIAMTFRTAGALISGRVLSGAASIADAFVGAWSRSGGFVETRSKTDGFYSIAVTSSDVWVVKAGTNIGGALSESLPASVDLTGKTSASQDLSLQQTEFRFPAPLTKQQDAAQPVSAKLNNGTQFGCAANCFGSSGQVNITVEPDVRAPDQGLTKVIGTAYNIEARKTDGSVVKSLSNDAVVSIPYDPGEVKTEGASEKDLQVAYFDDSTARWVPLATSVADVATHTVTATTSHLTRFALVTSAYSSIVTVTVHEGDLIRGPDKVKIYIVSAQGFKRHIFNPVIFNMYAHLKWENVKDVTQSTLDSYTTSDLYRAEGDPKVYSLEEVDEAKGLANKRWLDMTPERFAQAGYAWDQIFIVNPKERDFYQNGNAIK